VNPLGAMYEKNILPLFMEKVDWFNATWDANPGTSKEKIEQYKSDFEEFRNKMISTVCKHETDHGPLKQKSNGFFDEEKNKYIAHLENIYK
jgi:hypothetical protein